MPFDGTNFLKTVPLPVEFKPAPPRKGSLEWLAWLLRHEEEWPQGFRWDYDYEDCCAVGLYWRATGQPYRFEFNFSNRGYQFSTIYFRVQSLLDLKPRVMERLFTGMHGKRKMENIKPHHVAHDIEKYLARGY